jgi:hypothetical protein
VTVEYLPGEVISWFMDGLRESIAAVTTESLADLEEAQLYASEGYVEQMGWNRRGLRTDGTAEMHWGSWQPAFAGVEGPRDGGVPVIFARTEEGDVKVVISSFSTHPNCVAGGSFYSADIPGAVRKVIRRTLGDHVGVIYLTGAAGDTAPIVMLDNPENIQPWRGEEGLQRSGLYLGAEILQAIATATDPMPDQTVGHKWGILDVPMRPWPESFDPATLKGGFREFFMKSFEMWPHLMEEENPVPTPVHVVRAGNAAICTNPGELYCQYGLDIKERSPAEVTLVSELTDGCVGYVPTPEAILRSGYSAYPGLQCKLVPEAGEMVVEATGEMLEELFRGRS